LRIIFFGSGDFSRLLLENLPQSGLEIVGVVTQPDQPAGRGLKTRPTPLKEIALRRNLHVLQPRDIREEGLELALGEYRAELILVADYGQIFPPSVLQIPSLGSVNVHPSLLPRYRGPSPIQRALLEGDPVTGVTLMLMDEGLDSGPIIAQREVAIDDEDDFGTLRKKLALEAAGMLEEELPRFSAGLIQPKPQDDGAASYAAPLSKQELKIDWSLDRNAIRNKIRALSPSPGAYTYWRGKRIKLLRAELDETDLASNPGCVNVLGKKLLYAGTGSGPIRIEILQPEGRKAMSSAEFIRGYRPLPGEAFKDSAN
jgi:methionyl-tRNA formyltransferase